MRKARKNTSGKTTDSPPTFYDFVYAVVSNRAKAEEMLRERPHWIHETSSLEETALHYLAVENQVEAVRYLLSKGAKVDGAREVGTPLNEAAQLGYVEMVGVLIEGGAFLDARDIVERTPLLLAAQNGYAEICDRLLSAGADRDARDFSGSAVHDVALPRKREAIAVVLAKHDYPVADG